MITEKDIGKRVLVEKGAIYWPEKITFPLKGTIKQVHDNTLDIEFDSSNPYFHDCFGNTKFNHGWYVKKEQCHIIKNKWVFKKGEQ